MRYQIEYYKMAQCNKKYLRSTEQYFTFLPSVIGRDLMLNEAFQLLVQFSHEGRSWSYAVRVEASLLGDLDTLGTSLHLLHLRVLGRPESPASLLIDLSPGRHAVYRHEEQLLRAYHIEQYLHIVEYVLEDSLLGDAEADVVVVGMGTCMYDAVHIQI